MPRNEDISMQNVGEEEHLEINQDELNLDQASRPFESTRTRACVLLGSAILQLPIWGMKIHKPTWSIAIMDPNLPIQVSLWAMEFSKSTIRTIGLLKEAVVWPASSALPQMVSCTCPCRSYLHCSPDGGPADVGPLPSVALSSPVPAFCCHLSVQTSGISWRHKESWQLWDVLSSTVPPLYPLANGSRLVTALWHMELFYPVKTSSDLPAHSCYAVSWTTSAFGLHWEHGLLWWPGPASSLYFWFQLIHQAWPWTTRVHGRSPGTSWNIKHSTFTAWLSSSKAPGTVFHRLTWTHTPTMSPYSLRPRPPYCSPFSTFRASSHPLSSDFSATISDFPFQLPPQHPYQPSAPLYPHSSSGALPRREAWRSSWYSPSPSVSLLAATALPGAEWSMKWSAKQRRGMRLSIRECCMDCWMGRGVLDTSVVDLLECRYLKLGVRARWEALVMDRVMDRWLYLPACRRCSVGLECCGRGRNCCIWCDSNFYSRVD